MSTISDNAAHAADQAQNVGPGYSQLESEASGVTASSKRVPDLMDKHAFLHHHALNLELKAFDFRLISIMALDYHNSVTGELFPSHRSLAEKLGVTELTILRSLKRIEKAKVMRSRATYNGSGRTSNRYEFVGLDDCPTVIASRKLREENRLKKGDAAPSHLRVVVSNDGPSVSSEMPGGYQERYRVGISGDTNPPIRNDRGTKGIDIKGKDQSLSFNARVDRDAKEEGNGLSRIEIPVGLRDKKDREFLTTWGPIFRSIAEEFGFHGKDDIARVHGEFVGYYVEGNGKDVKSNNWEGLIRSWCRKGAEIRKSKSSSSSSSSQIPAELLDDSHPNRADFMGTLEPLAKKHGLQPTEWKDTLPRFKQMLGMPSSKALTVMEAWAIHLEDEKRKGNIQGTMKSRQRYAI